MKGTITFTLLALNRSRLVHYAFAVLSVCTRCHCFMCNIATSTLGLWPYSTALVVRSTLGLLETWSEAVWALR